MHTIEICSNEVISAAGGHRALSREGRVAMLQEVFTALLAGRMPSRSAALFVGGGGMAWLEDGGNLLRDYWKVSGERGSHRTVKWLLKHPSSR